MKYVYLFLKDGGGTLGPLEGPWNTSLAQRQFEAIHGKGQAVLLGESPVPTTHHNIRHPDEMVDK